MALFQPFKATTNPQNSKLVAATLKQAELDQQQQIAKNQAANANYASAIGLGGGMYGEYKDKESPIGQKLREWTGAESGEDVTIDANRLTGERTPTTPEDSLFDTPEYLPEEGSFYSDPAEMPSMTDGAGVVPTSTGPNSLFAPTSTATPDFGVTDPSQQMGQQAMTDAGADAGDQSLRATLEGFFGGGGDAAMEQGTEAAMEQATEQLADAGAEGITEAAGSSMMPGVGSLAAAANGDIEKAALKYATSLLPPPFNMLSFVV